MKSWNWINRFPNIFCIVKTAFNFAQCKKHSYLSSFSTRFHIFQWHSFLTFLKYRRIARETMIHLINSLEYWYKATTNINKSWNIAWWWLAHLYRYCWQFWNMLIHLLPMSLCLQPLSISKYKRRHYKYSIFLWIAIG